MTPWDFSTPCRILPESPVWLVANDQISKAEKILTDMARLNGVVMHQPLTLATQPSVDEHRHCMDSQSQPFNLDTKAGQWENSLEKEMTPTSNVRLLALVTDRRLLVHTIISSFLW